MSGRHVIGTNQPAVILVIQYLAENSGSYNVLRDLISHLDECRFSVALMLPEPSEIIGGLHSRVTLRYGPIPKLQARVTARYLVRFVREALYCIRTVRRVIKEEKVSIVHCSTLPNVVPALAAVLARVPLVWHVHELELHPRIVFRALIWLCRILSDRIVCVSSGVRALFGNSRKAIVIYNGVDLERLTPPSAEQVIEARRSLKLPEQSFVVTCLGRIVPIKGVDLFIRMAQEFLSLALPNLGCVRFLVVGGPVAGHERYFSTVLDALRSDACKGQVIYMPAMSDPHPVLAATDVLVQCSVIAESFGLNLVEAMAMGKPVIAHNKGGPLDIVRDDVDGYLVDSFDGKGRVEILTTLFSSPGLVKELGRNAHQRARDLFGAKRMAREFEALYLQLAENKA